MNLERHLPYHRQSRYRQLDGGACASVKLACTAGRPLAVISCWPPAIFDPLPRAAAPYLASLRGGRHAEAGGYQ